jgi:hypothetical protein
MYSTMLFQYGNVRPHRFEDSGSHDRIWLDSVTPPPSAQLSPSDFHLFRALRNTVCCVKFKTDGDVIGAVRSWLHEQDKEWYRQGYMSRTRNGTDTAT